MIQSSKDGLVFMMADLYNEKLVDTYFDEKTFSSKSIFLFNAYLQAIPSY